MQFLQIDVHHVDNTEALQRATWITLLITIIFTLLFYFLAAKICGGFPFISGRVNSKMHQIRKANADITALDISGWDLFDDDMEVTS